MFGQTTKFLITGQGNDVNIPCSAFLAGCWRARVQRVWPGPTSAILGEDPASAPLRHRQTALFVAHGQPNIPVSASCAVIHRADTFET